MIDTDPTITYSPVAHDGDALLRASGPISEVMARVDVLPDGGFAVGDGSKDPTGRLSVYSDKTGEMLRTAFADENGQAAAFDAWAERAKLASGMLQLPSVLADRGGRELLSSGTSRAVALNGRGELGKVNLLAGVSANGDGVTLVEKDGLPFMVRKRIINGEVTHMAWQVEEGRSIGISDTDVEVGLGEIEGVKVVTLRALDHDKSVEIDVAATNGNALSSTIKSGILRSAYQKVRQIRDRSQGDEVPSHDFNAMAKAIDLSLQQLAEDRAAEKSRIYAEAARLELEKMQIEELSIAHLTEINPMAGNLFQPGAGLYEDQLWKKSMQRHGLEVGTEGWQDKLQVLLKDETIRADVTEILRARLDAWCEAEPALKIRRQIGAFKALESHFGLRDPRYVKENYPKDSLMHYASTDKRTIANMEIPEGVQGNRVKGPDSAARFGHPSQIRCRDYVVRLALAMMDGSFDPNYEENLYSDKRYSDEKGRVVIHEAAIAQNRTSARLLLYGDC